MKQKRELSYGALVSDRIDAGVPVSETIAKQMFVIRPDDFSFEFAHVDWKTEEAEDLYQGGWCDENNEEIGRHWVIVYRYYPTRETRPDLYLW